MHAGSERDHERRRRPVQREARRDLFGAGLQEIGGGRRRRPFGGTEDAEDRADRNVDIEVERAVERVEREQIAPARVFGGNQVGRFRFGRGDAAELAAPLAFADHDLVSARRVGVQRSTGNGRCDEFARGLDVVEQRRQIRIRLRFAPLFDNKFAKRRTAIRHWRVRSPSMAPKPLSCEASRATTIFLFRIVAKVTGASQLSCATKATFKLPEVSHVRITLTSHVR